MMFKIAAALIFMGQTFGDQKIDVWTGGRISDGQTFEVRKKDVQYGGQTFGVKLLDIEKKTLERGVSILGENRTQHGSARMAISESCDRERDKLILLNWYLKGWGIVKNPKYFRLRNQYNSLRYAYENSCMNGRFDQRIPDDYR